MIQWSPVITNTAVYEIPAVAKSFLGTEFFPVIFNIIKYGYNESSYSKITLITKAGFPQN